MKKINLNGKLSLKKETIAKLNNDQMNNVIGGRPNTQSPTVCNCSAACILTGTKCSIGGASCIC